MKLLINKFPSEEKHLFILLARSYVHIREIFYKLELSLKLVMKGEREYIPELRQFSMIALQFNLISETHRKQLLSSISRLLTQIREEKIKVNEQLADVLPVFLNLLREEKISSQEQEKVKSYERYCQDVIQPKLSNTSRIRLVTGQRGNDHGKRSNNHEKRKGENYESVAVKY